MTPVTIEIRQVQGGARIYPANALAHDFADLLGCKTFSLEQLTRIERCGHPIHMGDR